MADETKPTFGPQPYQFGQDVPPTTEESVQETTEVKEEPTGVEDISYDVVTPQGMPDNPKNAREVVERGVVNVANPQKAKPEVNVEAQVAPELSEEERQRQEAVEGYDGIISTLEQKAKEYEPETPEQKKKRERREKSARIISAVSDGLSALSNLYFTSQYAPNMYNHEKSSQLNPLQAQLEKAKKEREANADKYLQFALQLGDAKNDRAKTLRELEAQQERQKLAREKAKREEEAHGWEALLQPDKQRRAKGLADKAEQEAVTAEAEANNAPAMQAAKLDTEKARAGAQRASAAASKASAANSYASAAAHNRSNVSEFSAWDEHGREHKFRTEAAANAYAKQHGTYKETDESETTNTSRTWGKRTTTSTSTKTKKSGHAAKPDPTDLDDPTA